ncbi:MAG: hypothetical protein R2746_11590 [Acidimicrobiales bacterium]
MTSPDPLAAAFGTHRGVVRRYDDAVGAGTLADDATGVRWSFHCTRIADGSRTIAPGTPVTFLVAPGPVGLEAVEVAAGP